MDRPLEVQICEDLLELQGYSASKIEIADYKGKPEIQKTFAELTSENDKLELCRKTCGFHE